MVANQRKEIRVQNIQSNLQGQINRTKNALQHALGPEGAAAAAVEKGQSLESRRETLLSCRTCNCSKGG